MRNQWKAKGENCIHSFLFLFSFLAGRRGGLIFTYYISNLSYPNTNMVFAGEFYAMKNCKNELMMWSNHISWTCTGRISDVWRRFHFGFHLEYIDINYICGCREREILIEVKNQHPIQAFTSQCTKNILSLSQNKITLTPSLVKLFLKKC